ncbi:MAG: hypothetical protein ACREUF_06280, partial [Solimonas sp.]
LQTSLGFYIANGIPVGNCRHRFVPVNADTLRERGTYNALSRFSQSQEQVENLADYRERIRPTPRRTLPELRVVSESTTEVRARLLDVISAARLEGFLQRVPLRQIDFVRRMPARTAHGVYSIQQQRIWVNTQRPRSSYGQEWVPGSNWSVSMLGRNALEAKQRTFAHELGHHIHLSITRPTHLALGAEIGTQADAEVARAFRSGRPLTVYASRIDYEYFAESFAAYVFERERLRQFDPVGHDMVRRVLQLAGIE